MSPLPPKPSSDGTWIWLLVILLFCGGLGTAVYFFMMRMLKLHPVPVTVAMPTTPTPPSMPPVIFKRLTFYTDDPIVTTVDGDAIDDVVSMRWDPSDQTSPLYVVAVSGVTFDPLWTAGPFPSQWASSRTRLVKSGDKLFLTESTSHLHILDLKSGGVDHKQLLEATPARMVGAASGAPRAFVNVEGEWQKGLLIDAEGTVTRTTMPPSFDAAPTTCEKKKPDPDEMCESWQGPLGKTAGFELQHAVRRGDLGVTMGTITVKGFKTIHTPHLVGFDPATKKVRWERDAALDADPLQEDARMVSRLTDKLYVLYQLRSGTWKVGAFDAMTGDVLFATEVPNGQNGTYFESFQVKHDRIYVVMTHRLEVFDASNGAHKRTVGL